MGAVPYAASGIGTPLSALGGQSCLARGRIRDKPRGVDERVSTRKSTQDLSFCVALLRVWIAAWSGGGEGCAS